VYCSNKEHAVGATCLTQGMMAGNAAAALPAVSSYSDGSDVLVLHGWPPISVVSPEGASELGAIP
jgi:hypothetical protein